MKISHTGVLLSREYTTAGELTGMHAHMHTRTHMYTHVHTHAQTRAQTLLTSLFKLNIGTFETQIQKLNRFRCAFK